MARAPAGATPELNRMDQQPLIAGISELNALVVNAALRYRGTRATERRDLNRKSLRSCVTRREQGTQASASSGATPGLDQLKQVTAFCKLCRLIALRQSR